MRTVYVPSLVTVEKNKQAPPHTSEPPAPCPLMSFCYYLAKYNYYNYYNILITIINTVVCVDVYVIKNISALKTPENN